MNILIFAGTKNGREIISSLKKDEYMIYSSFSSEYGSSLITEHPNLIKLVGKLTSQEIKNIIIKKSINLIIDSTHPYALNVSKNIQKASKQCGIDLIRYERKSVIPSNIGRHFKSMESACLYLTNLKGNILFTTGVNKVPDIVDHINRERVFVRVLPIKSSKDIIKRCGLDKYQVIVKNPPFTLEENINHIEKNNIKFLVTKDSGLEGNIAEKIDAVSKMSIELIVIDRPEISFDLIYHNEEEIKEHIYKLNRSE